MAIRTKPRGYQLEAAERCVKQEGRFAIHFKAGTGKTLAALLCSEKLKARTILIFCSPSAIYEVWERQINLHIRGGKAIYFDVDSFQENNKRNYLILSYGIGKNIYTKLRRKFDLFIVDESHRMSKRGTQQSRRINSIAQVTPYHVQLTGDPIRKDELDLYGQYRAIDKDLLGTYEEFFAEYGTRGKKLAPFVFMEFFNKAKKDQLIELLAPYTADQDADLKFMPKELPNNFVGFDLPNKAVKIYRDILKDMLYECDEFEVAPDIALTRDLRLAQITSGFVTDDDDNIQRIHNAKIKAYEDWYENFSTKEQLITFYRFKPEREDLHKLLPKAEIIEGGQKTTDRAAIIRGFRERKFKDLHIQIQAGGESIDGLQEHCHYGMFYSCNYSYVDNNQCRARLVRDGQKHPVGFWYMQARRTIDQRIFKLIQSKKSTSEDYRKAMREYLLTSLVA